MPKDENTVTLKPNEVVIDQKTLAAVLEGQAKIEKELEDQKAKNAGLEAMMLEGKDSDTTGDKKPRTRKDFTPAFRTVTIKKFPINGDPEKEGYVIGWTNRGAYQKVDKSGISAQTVDYIDIIFLDHERNEEKKLQAESVPLLVLMGAPEVTCKVLEVKDYEGKPMNLRYSPLIDPDLSLDRPGEQKQYTGEMIRVTTFDPKHGLVETGEEIEGWVGRTDMTFVIQIPGRAEPIEIDSKFVNM